MNLTPRYVISSLAKTQQQPTVTRQNNLSLLCIHLHFQVLIASSGTVRAHRERSIEFVHIRSYFVPPPASKIHNTQLSTFLRGQRPRFGFSNTFPRSKDSPRSGYPISSLVPLREVQLHEIQPPFPVMSKVRSMTYFHDPHIPTKPVYVVHRTSPIFRPYCLGWSTLSKTEIMVNVITRFQTILMTRRRLILEDEGSLLPSQKSVIGDVPASTELL